MDIPQLPKEQREQWIGRLMNVAGGVATLLLLVGFYAVVYRPLSERQAAHVGRTEQLQMLLAHAGTLHREHSALCRELVELRATATATRARIPAELLEADFVSDIQQIAAATGLEVLEHRLSAPTPIGGLQQRELGFRCRGSYASVCRFLSESEQLARITKISQLQLVGDDKSASTTFLVTFVLYYGVDTNDTNERRAVL